jgi:hypothetical protein
VYHESKLKDSMLESQLLSYPNCAAWEMTDCLGYIVQVLDKMSIHFAPRQLGADEAEPDFFDEGDGIDEWEELAESGNWRVAVP